MIVSAFVRLVPDTSLTQVIDAARTLEASGVAAVCFLDSADTGTAPALFESTTLAAAVAVQTSTIGVVASDSALYGFPYHAARRLATIDHLSSGRSGWLLRTAPAAQEATAYEWRSGKGRGEELHRCTEYAEIALELWDSWEDGAQWPDKEVGTYKDDSRIHPIDYRSTSFRVAGPLDVPPSPQRRPVLFAEISAAEDAIHLTPYVDVAVIVAGDRPSAAALADVVASIDPSTLVLVAGAIEGASDMLADREALAMAETLQVAGVALYLVPSAAESAAALVSAAPAGLRSGTLADSLGIGSTLSQGGHAA
jgi:alkanesulfonate monooxygenase SsuD/methylene tetrahydromethanopterin reductase-like flavin-dependent oxidoreductase (luciferase family)